MSIHGLHHTGTGARAGARRAGAGARFPQHDRHRGLRPGSAGRRRAGAGLGRRRGADVVGVARCRRAAAGTGRRGSVEASRLARPRSRKLVAGERRTDEVLVRPSPASFALSDTGEVRLEPAGSGWRWLASALWGEILLSQQHDTWRRIKTCHNHQCGSAFYDRSKNNSGVWCNVKTCGNAANLRASRARRARTRSAAAAKPW